MKFVKKHADLFLGSGIALFLFLAVFVLQGFAKYGLSVPFNYAGGDDFSSLVTAKLVEESGWFWFNDRIGAPFGGTAFDFTANMLLNFDIFVVKILSWFTSNAVVANNLRYILIFPMCGVSAFCVLRALKVGRVLSSFGSLVFALTPYIFFRGMLHFSLSTCYLVPVSVLICMWAIYNGDDGYLKLNKSFFKNRKNVLTVIFALLIANNGIGYYAIFTCFFLCVIALCNLLTTKKIGSVWVPAKIIVLIGGFVVLALLPVVIYTMINGGNSGAVGRGFGEAEIYGLKIVQLFVPIYPKTAIGRLISGIYNTYMPLVNENQSAYLGIFGIIGFLLSLLFIMKRDTEGDTDGRLYVLSRMNLAAILLTTIGGFSSIISFVFQMIRGYNRISIFIMFISVLFLCTVLQRALESGSLFKTEKIKKISCAAVLAVMTLSVLELLPTYGSNDWGFESYKTQLESDKAFVEDIEETLGENAMVFQLPYHQTPEAGPVNNMMDYHLYVGYINSDTLRWSYGVTKGRDGDRWLRQTSALPAAEMLDTVSKAGFTGIYIDARAYTAEQFEALKTSLGAYLGEVRVSQNGNLMFYDLRGYIAEKGITVDPSVYAEIPETQIYSASEVKVSGEHTVGFNAVTLKKDAVLTRSFSTLEPGKYTVKVYGSGLVSAGYTLGCADETHELTFTKISETDGAVVYEITVTETHFETGLKITANSENEVIFNRIEFEKNK